MKKTYVRPTMKAELYTPNAYCGVCQDNPTLNTSILNVDYGTTGSQWLSSSRYAGASWLRDRAWKDDGNFATTHTFPATPRYNMTNPHNNQPQWYWKCSCHSGSEQYYLEYSANWSQGRGEDSFVLFKEATGNNSLKVGDATSWPDYNHASNEDLAVAMVTYTNPVIANS